jgi:hypothetical protein
VVYNEEGYFEPTKKQWSHLLGKKGFANLSKPFSYIAPPGVIAGACLLLALVGLFFLGSRKDDEDEDEASNDHNQHESVHHNEAA